MTDALSLFDDDSENPEATAESAAPEKMTEGQRSRIRGLFHDLGIADARGQFDVVRELTGQSISAVSELSRADAQRLIRLLPAKITGLHAGHTGSAWADRSEDTWIDRL